MSTSLGESLAKIAAGITTWQWVPEQQCYVQVVPPPKIDDDGDEVERP